MKKILKKAVIAAGLLSLASVGFANTLQNIQERGAVNLGVRESSGLSYALGNGKFVGFHTEMAEIIVSDIAKHLNKPDLKINYVPITSQNRIPLIQNGTIDFECGTTTNNKSRQKEVSFANTTYIEEVKIAVKKDSGINSLKDLDGKTIATTTGTTSVQTLRKNKRAEGIDFKEVNGKDHADSFLLLETGRADAFVMDGSILAANISKSKDPSQFMILDDVLSIEPIACMLSKDDTELQELINASIKRQIEDGSLLNLYNRWFLEPIPPKDIVIGLPLPEKTKEVWANPNNNPMEDYN
ncbi:amino acid ABC transporter substrate-binding protein [Thorsellia kenyensis]|uniref:Amino acid ABC transporter substrate-binding protein n=1 Tax=Thorsellia kenyensis TaxID=1549888 RepID=A0ABV6C7Z9_9GAMM